MPARKLDPHVGPLRCEVGLETLNEGRLVIEVFGHGTELPERRSTFVRGVVAEFLYNAILDDLHDSLGVMDVIERIGCKDDDVAVFSPSCVF
jgi:hypothetical protein